MRMRRQVTGFVRALRRGGPRDGPENTPRLTREIGRTRSPKKYSRSKRPNEAVSYCPECLKPLHYDRVQGYCPEHGEPEARRVAGPSSKGGDTGSEGHSDED